MRRFTLVCDDRQAQRVERLASRYDLTEREVLRQLLALGLESLDPDEEDATDRPNRARED